MSEKLDDELKFEDLISRFESLHEDIIDRLAEAEGDHDAKQVDELRRDIRVLGLRVGDVLKTMDRKPQPKIGDVVTVVNYEYDMRGGIFDHFYEQGTVVAVDGDEIEVHIAEKSILETIEEHTVQAAWHACVNEWVDIATDPEWYVTKKIEELEDASQDEAV